MLIPATGALGMEFWFPFEISIGASARSMKPSTALQENYKPKTLTLNPKSKAGNFSASLPLFCFSRKGVSPTFTASSQNLPLTRRRRFL